MAGESLNVTLTFSGFTTDETIYVKGAFFSEGSTNYFGLTKNGDTWVKNSGSATTQPSVKVSSSPATLQVKNDPFDSGFHGEGEYKFKVGYYYLTSGGNLSSVNWSDTILSIRLAAPVPTSTPTPTPKPTPTSVQLPTPTIHTSNTTDTTLTIANGNNVQGEEEDVPEVPTMSVLSAQITPTSIPTKSPVAVDGVSTSSLYLPILFGLGMILLCAILICRKMWNFKFPFEH